MKRNQINVSDVRNSEIFSNAKAILWHIDHRI